MAEPVVLPATLDVTNVSFRSEDMPDFVLSEGDYAGTYFDMGAHDSSNDTLLYAEWDVTIQPIKYNIAVDVYNTNSWRVQLHLLNQAGDTVKDLRYKGSSGQCGQFGIGSMDMSDLEAGNYKLRARAATAWSAMKLKDVIFAADYQGVSVNLPGTLLPAYALLSAGASATASSIAFAPSTANQEYATWNVSFAKADDYNVTIALTASNGHNYSVELLSEDGLTQIDSLGEGGQKGDTGEKELGTITVPAAGNYVVKLRNATQWSEALLNSITFASNEPIIPQYEVAEAIEAGLEDSVMIQVRGVITKMEFKGKNFAKYGSVNIYVKDATGEEGEFEFFNCYSLEADTFKASVPEYDEASTSWAQFTEVSDGKGNTLHLKDTVIAIGKYKLFNTTHELVTGCYLIDVKPYVAGEPDTIALDFSEGSGWVSNEDFEEWGATDLVLYNIPVVGEELVGDGDYLALDFYPEDANDISGTYSIEDESLDADYSGLMRVNGTDTVEIAFVDGEVTFAVLATSEEQMAAQIAIAAVLTGDDDNIYTVTGTFVLYYDFIIEEGIEDVVLDPKKSIKAIRNGQLLIECEGKTFNAQGAIVK